MDGGKATRLPLQQEQQGKEQEEQVWPGRHLCQRLPSHLTPHLHLFDVPSRGDTPVQCCVLTTVL